MNTNFFSSRPKSRDILPESWFPWVSRVIPTFLSPPLSRGTPPPHLKTSGPKSLGLCSFFVSEALSFSAVLVRLYACNMSCDCTSYMHLARFWLRHHFETTGHGIALVEDDDTCHSLRALDGALFTSMASKNGSSASSLKGPSVTFCKRMRSIMASYCCCCCCCCCCCRQSNFEGEGTCLIRR